MLSVIVYLTLQSNREYMLMVELLVPFYQQLKSAPYGRKVLSHLEAGMMNNPDQSGYANIFDSIDSAFSDCLAVSVLP
jgi:hypothetical protein